MRRDLRFIVLIREDFKSLSYFKTLSDYPESNLRPPASQPDAQPTESSVRGCLSLTCYSREKFLEEFMLQEGAPV